jgi:zinc transporter
MNYDDCVLFSYHLDGRGSGQPDNGKNSSQPELSWVHIDFSAGNPYQWLAERGIDPNVIDSLIRLDSRPRALRTEHGVLIVLRGINCNAGSDPEDMVSLRIWIEPGAVITVRQRRVMAARAVLTELEQGTGPKNSAELVLRLIERITDGVGEFVDQTDARIEEYENIVESQNVAAVRQNVSAVRREVAVVRRYLAPQRDALESLHRQDTGTSTADQRYLLRELSDRVIRYVEDLDLIRERTLVLQEELTNRVAQEQNSRTYVLSVVAAIFLPITFIASIFGMNTAGLPGLEDVKSFWIVSGVMLATLLAIMLWLWRKRWF